MDKSTKENRYEVWYQRILDWSQSGLTRAEYCERHGISLKSFYYYQRRIRELLAEQLQSQQGVVIPEDVTASSGLLSEETTPRPRVMRLEMHARATVPQDRLEENTRGPQIVKLDMSAQATVPQDRLAGMVHFSVNGMDFVVEEDINPSFLSKLIRASADNGTRGD